MRSAVGENAEWLQAEESYNYTIFQSRIFALPFFKGEKKNDYIEIGRLNQRRAW